MPKLTTKQKYWSEQLIKADGFEGSLAEYALTQNIPIQTLYYWRSYLKRSAATEPKTKPAFTQVISAPAADFCIRLHVGNIQLQFARLPDPRWLSEFITAVHTS
tara:strand:- start:27648 stop:27959 length:312 start_codon:yes stop_codon:yes gene_type:complete